MPTYGTTPGRLRSRLSRAVRGAAALALAGAAGACDLDLVNPNAPTQEEIVTSFDGLVAVAVGMQDQYASTMDDYLIPNSLVTDEWGTRQLALASYTTLLTGIEIDDSYATVLLPWANSYETIRSANTILEAQIELGPVFGPSLRALAKTYKAMALGRLIQIYEEVPIDITVDAPVPQPRAEVLNTILTLLEEARADIAPLSDTDLAPFRTRVIGNDFDLANVIDAMLARYYLIAGDYASAAAAAEDALAGMEEISYFLYVSPDVNPIYNITVPTQYVAVAKQWAREAEPGDARVSYWADTTVSLLPNTAEEIFAMAKYQTQAEPLPVFLPDEMKLIRAEALVRLGAANYPEALALINEVREQSDAEFDEPVADLDPVVLTTEAQLLAQIEYERRYELYMQGHRWEDMRRFGAAVAGEAPTIDFLPIPQQECDANPSNPCGA